LCARSCRAAAQVNKAFLERVPDEGH
jgi:hypothetical protein